MYPEEDLLPISALNQLIFCKRRCAMMLLEGQWSDNEHTVIGSLQHERVDQAGHETRGQIRRSTGLRVRSLKLGLTGKADVVEFHLCPTPAEAVEAVELEGVDGLWRPYPVEHKKGTEKPDLSDQIQLCAQALCLEEMLEGTVNQGAIFYNESRDRLEVEICEDLRTSTTDAARQLHELVEAGQVPPARPDKRCHGCSLQDTCSPELSRIQTTASAYVDGLLDAILDNKEQTP